MSIDFNDPEVQRAIQERATEVAQSIISDKYVPVEDINGLKAKNTELLGKIVKNKEKYGDLNENDLSELVRVKSAREHDQFIDMIMNGKTAEAKALATEGAIAPWKEKVSDFEGQFSAAQSSISEKDKEIKDLHSKVTGMQKRQFLRELTSKDDSFKNDHFEDFYMLNQGKIDIDQDSGVVYALDSNGKSVLDTDGNKVAYSAFYDKQKVSNGLFWNGGSGSGAKGSGAGEGGLGNDPSKWTQEQKIDYIRENGPEKFGQMLSSAKK